MERTGNRKDAGVDGEGRMGNGTHRRIPRKMTIKRARNVAENYVAQRECSRRMLEKVLERRLDSRLRSLPADEREGERIEAIPIMAAEVDRLVRLGFVDDRRFAANRARSGFGSGHGMRRIENGLVAKGVDPAVAEAVIREIAGEVAEAMGEDGTGDDRRDAEFSAARTLARRKRLGPWRKPADLSDRTARDRVWRREAGALARAGFGPDVVRKVLEARSEDDLA